MGVGMAITNVAFAGFILDIAPSNQRSEYFAVHNAAVGIVTFAGSLLGG